MTRVVLSAVLILVGVTWVLYGVVTVDRRDDAAQIRSLIADTASAVEKRDLGGVMRCVSEDYRDNDGNSHDRLRMLVAQALRAETDYTASAQVQRIAMNDDRAVVELHAVVKSGQGTRTIYERDLTLAWRKESGRHLLIIPVSVWRVVKSENLAIPDM